MSQQQPRPWFRLGSFVRPAPVQAPAQPPPTQTLAPQQPIVRPSAPLFRPAAPQPTPPPPPPPQQTLTPPRPPVTVTAPRSPVTSTLNSPKAPSPNPGSPAAPLSPTAPSSRSPPPSPPTTTTPLSRFTPPSPAAPAPAPKSPLRSPVAPTPPTVTASRSPPPSPVAPAPRAAPTPRLPLRFSAPPSPATVTASRSPPPSPAGPAPAARLPLRFSVAPPPASQSPPPPLTAPPAPQPRTINTSPVNKTTTPSWQTSSNTSTNLHISSSSVPTSPMRKVTKPASPSRSPPPSEPISNALFTNHANTSLSSPKTVNPLLKTPPQSPHVKPISHPPSPLTLPPAQIKPEFEQKTITTEKPKVMPRNSPTYEQRYIPTTNKLNGQNGKAKDNNHKKNSGPEEHGMRVITLAGENKGAVMEFSPSRNNANHRNGKKLGSDNGTVNEEERSIMKDKNHKAMGMGMESPPMTAFMNSNVQGVNNSILFNVSCTHNDPGVHLTYSRKPNGHHGNHVKDHTKN